MQRMDGISTAQYIRKIDKEVIIVFQTNMSQYAIQGYSVDAFEYLLKPIQYMIFTQLMKKIERSFENKNSDFIFLPFDNGAVKLTTKEIVYIENYKHKLIIKTIDSEYIITGAMKHFEAMLVGKNFFRVNFGCLVNLAWVKSISNSIVKVRDHEIQISRTKKKLFMKTLADYFGGLK